MSERLSNRWSPPSEPDNEDAPGVSVVDDDYPALPIVPGKWSEIFTCQCGRAPEWRLLDDGRYSFGHCDTWYTTAVDFSRREVELVWVSTRGFRYGKQVCAEAMGEHA